MFSGIVETVGRVCSVENTRDCLCVSIAPQKKFRDIRIGDSIAVNGVCLTVTEIHPDRFNMTIVPETLRITNLNAITENTEVNLERSLKVSDRISGHCVQGHVDGVGKISEIKNDGGDAWIVKINVPEKLSKYIVKKGFITLDGMSITIIEAGKKYFTVTLIPHTQQVTIANQYHIGSTINIEIDIFAKTVERLLRRG